MGQLSRGVGRASLAGVGDVNLDFFQALEAFRYAVGGVSHLCAVGRDSDALYAIRRSYDRLRAGRFACLCFFVGILGFLLVLLVLFGLLDAQFNLPLQGFGDGNSRDHVTAFLFTVADDVFPLLLVFIFLF